MMLQPGDIVATRGKSWVSKAIRFFTRGLGESRTKVNHVGIITVGGPATSAVVTEALRTVQSHRLWMQYGPPDGDDVAIFRRKHTAFTAARIVARKAEKYVGKKYGYLKIAAHTLDYLLFGAFVFRRLARLENYPICSWLVARAYAEIGVTFGVPYEECAPDHIWDWVNGHPNEWECLQPLGALDGGTIPRDAILAGNFNLKEK